MLFKLLSVSANNPPIKMKYFPNKKIDNNKINSLINPVIVLFPFYIIIKFCNDKFGRI